MKKYFFIYLLLAVQFIFAQAPQKMSFQAVVRDGSGTLISNSNVGVKISILQTSENGNIVFSETHTVSSNLNGLITLEVGTGTILLGTFASIDWANGPYFIKTETDPTGGTNYSVSGTSQLLSVPYALYAGSSNNISGWSINGNGNLDNSNFIGTTNNVDIIFKRNNLFSGKIGLNNTALGTEALNETTTGVRNTAIGSNVLTANTSGSRNTAIGENTMFSNTTGGENVAMGVGTLYSNTTGNQNTAVGRNAMTTNTIGSSNTAIGYLSIRSNISGEFNSALGRASLLSNVSGNQNTAAGVNAMFGNTQGNNNSAYGVQALRNNVTGNNNTSVGHQALFANTDGQNNTAIGTNAFQFGTSFSNSTAIGANTIITASDQVRVGDANITSIGGQVSWTTLSDGRFKVEVEENVPGLSFITKIKPVSYKVDKSKINAFHGNSQNHIDLSGKTVGFIAQDVEKVANEIGFEFNGVDKPKNDSDYYGIRYSDFVAPLVKAVQEQQKEIEELQLLNKELLMRLEKLENKR